MNASGWVDYKYKQLEEYSTKFQIVSERVYWVQENLFGEKTVTKISWYCPFKPETVLGMNHFNPLSSEWTSFNLIITAFEP